MATSDTTFAFVQVDPTIKVKDRPYQRKVRSFVMKRFHQQVEAAQVSSKHFRASSPKHLRSSTNPSIAICGEVNCTCRPRAPSKFPFEISISHSIKGCESKSGCPLHTVNEKPTSHGQELVLQSPKSYMDIGLKDPFDSLAVPLDNLEYSLIDYWNFNLARDFTPHSQIAGDILREHYLSFAITNPALIYAVLYCFTLYRVNIHTHDEDTTSLALEKSKAVRMINKQVGNAVTALSDSTFAAVASMAGNELITGNLEEAAVHSIALRRILELRGGVQSLKSNPILRIMVAWILPSIEEELYEREPGNWATIFDEPSADLNAEASNISKKLSGHVSWSPASPTNSPWLHSCPGRITSQGGIGFVRLGSNLKLTDHQFRLLGSIHTLTATTGSSLSLLDRNIAVQSHLTKLWTVMAEQLKTWRVPNVFEFVCTIQCHYHRVCRRTALTFVWLVLFKIHPSESVLQELSPDPVEQLYRIFNRGLGHCKVAPQDKRPAVELLLWYFVLDALRAKARNEDYMQLLRSIRRLCATLQLQSWFELRSTLELFLWSRAVLESDGERLWRDLALDMDKTESY